MGVEELCSSSLDTIEELYSSSATDTCGVRSIAVKSSEVNTEKGLKTRHFRQLEVLFRLSDFLGSWYLLPGEKIG